jgi:hypothetical protein
MLVTVEFQSGKPGASVSRPHTTAGGASMVVVMLTVNPDRCRVEVQQFVAGTEQARFMDRAWRLVLGRFLSRIVDALDPAVTLAPFPPRPRAVEPESVG